MRPTYGRYQPLQPEPVSQGWLGCMVEWSWLVIVGASLGTLMWWMLTH